MKSGTYESFTRVLLVILFQIYLLEKTQESKATVNTKAKMEYHHAVEFTSTGVQTEKGY